MMFLRSLFLFACLTCVAAAGVPNWEASIASLSPGFVATGISAPTELEIGTYDASTGGGVTYEVLYNAEVGGASSAFFGSLGAPEGESAAFKLDQFSNTGTFGVTQFGVADLNATTPSVFGADTQAVLVADGTDGLLYINGEFAETITGGSFALSGLTGIGHAFVHSSGASIDALNGEILGIAIYDTALSADAIAANFAAFIPEPASAALVALGVIGAVSTGRARG